MRHGLLAQEGDVQQRSSSPTSMEDEPPVCNQIPIGRVDEANKVQQGARALLGPSGAVYMFEPSGMSDSMDFADKASEKGLRYIVEAEHTSELEEAGEEKVFANIEEEGNGMRKWTSDSAMIVPKSKKITD
eukprot:GHVT01064827.1.p1 GENE.GHVT01064827.1~~GHVT01064827.1.p1  ORF type:complete len:131 (-),score=21.12 GHVT01064827.1:71-463(-)